MNNTSDAENVNCNELLSKQSILHFQNLSYKVNLTNIRSISLGLLEEYKNLAELKGNFGISKENGFREIVQKDIGRYDLNLDHLLSPPKTRLFSSNENIMVSIVQEVRNHIDAALNSILGSQFIVNAFGLVISMPGTNEQRWHVDSSHLFAPSDYSTLTSKDLEHVLPCHFVTVFCPLYDYVDGIGPTEIALGTHKHTNMLNNSYVKDQYPEDAVVDSILAKAVEIRTMKCSIGDIVIMDGRTLHRGMANTSNQPRSLMYLSFCRPWYHEFPRSQNEDKSIF